MEGDERGRSHTTRQPTDDGATRDDDIVQRRRWRSRRGGTGSGPSTRNALGTTWEEKDATDWCMKTLEWCLLDAPASPYFSELSSTACVASVKGVLDVKGDASVAIAGGKKRYIFDYHATVEYEISDGGGEVVASGSLRLPEVHSPNMSSGKRRRSWRWRYWLGSARRPPPPGTTISERASRRKKRRMSKDTFHGRQEEHFGIRGEVQRTKYLGPQWVLMLPQLHPHSHHRRSCH